mgnify:CR=1 FL=1
MQETTERKLERNRKGNLASAVGGLVAGVIVTLVTVLLVMPGLMIVTQPSRLDFDATVATLEQELKEQGWASPGTIHLNKSMARHGVELTPRVAVVQLCKAKYAKSVLQTDRYVSCLMPCSVSVWEGDDGTVYVSKMNTGLMGKLFGGNVAAVMGNHVAREEHAILTEVISD